MDSINISPVARKATRYSLIDGASINKSIFFILFELSYRHIRGEGEYHVKEEQFTKSQQQYFWAC